MSLSLPYQPLPFQGLAGQAVLPWNEAVLLNQIQKSVVLCGSSPGSLDDFPQIF
jgi:hypothetical protein